MNIQNLGSQESTGVKYIDGICTKFCCKLCLEGTGIFSVLLSQDGFVCNPETKFETSSS